MRQPSGRPQLLPGMAEITQPSGRIVAAVSATLAALDLLDLLEPRHAAPAQLALELALAVEHGIASRRASAAALAARELREVLTMLPAPPEVSDDTDAFTAFMRDLSQASDE